MKFWELEEEAGEDDAAGIMGPRVDWSCQRMRKLSRKQIKRKGVSLKAMDAAEVAVAVPAASPPPG